MANDTLSHYQKVQIETARKEKLISMLLEGAIRFLTLAKNDTSEDIWTYRMNILKAESMLLELIASLNFDKGGEIAVSLHKLYIYMVDLLSTVIEERGPAKITEVLSLLVPLKDTWNEAVQKHFEETAQATQAAQAASGAAGERKKVYNMRA